MMQPEISLILPCYNEAEHFIGSVDKIVGELKKLKIPCEVIFVEDKSTDNTRELLGKYIDKIRSPLQKVIYHSNNTGRGQTVTDGILTARGEWVGFIDIDCEIAPVYIADFIRQLKSGSDVVYGIRHYAVKKNGILRAVVSKSYSYLVQLILKTKIIDTEAGFKFFKRSKILPILNQVKAKGWFWDTEVMVKSERAGLKIKGLPVEFVRRMDKTSTVHLVSDSIDYLLKLLRFRVDL